MNSKNFWMRITGTIFAVVALLHLLRILSGIAIWIGGWFLPFWMNWMGFVVTSLLSMILWKLSFRKADQSR
ncbi:MAG TPA: hypothetical protein PKG48_00655 [Bacteroidales bacterium]|nr:hypothetical protein [Bacteroidales bacterium]HPS63263.1 hypothetical protein [Bacteroidales bacterium]